VRFSSSWFYKLLFVMASRPRPATAAATHWNRQSVFQRHRPAQSCSAHQTSATNSRFIFPHQYFIIPGHTCGLPSSIPHPAASSDHLASAAPARLPMTHFSEFCALCASLRPILLVARSEAKTEAPWRLRVKNPRSPFGCLCFLLLKAVENKGIMKFV
jgi:hypothetical protein